jgi:arylsulfatase A-like enzyme
MTNVVLIVCDDMGYSDVGCYGGELDTPAIDGLAHGGVRL